MVTEPHATVAFKWDPAKILFPVRFHLGQCTVAIYSKSTAGSEVFPLLTVSRVAGLIVKQCATRQTDYLGGRLEVGPKSSYWVSVTQ